MRWRRKQTKQTEQTIQGWIKGHAPRGAWLDEIENFADGNAFLDAVPLGSTVEFVADVAFVVQPSLTGATRLILEDFSARGVLVGREPGVLLVLTRTPLNHRRVEVRLEYHRMSHFTVEV